MNLFDVLTVARYLLRTRLALRFSSRQALLDWQAKQIERFLAQTLPKAAFYRPFAGQPLSALPVMDKAGMLQHFQGMNTAGISLDQASQVALAAEQSRDFSPRIGRYSVGLSSGTQGPQGVFLVADQERAMWAGIMLARTLSGGLLCRLLRPFGPKIRVAFFLRANSNLYQTLKSRRIDFRFYDLFAGVEPHLQSLQQQSPDVLVAPARVLAWIADQVAAGRLQIKPVRVISVAEVLEPDDALRIAQAFKQPVHQLYQCTEGFLGYTCEQGVLHLNEEYVHVEPEWLDEAHTRFTPIVTDFTRKTQLIVRQRLNDVLRVRSAPCTCGRHGQALESIEGRADDVLWFRQQGSDTPMPLFPDIVRHALLRDAIPVDYRIAQQGDVLEIAVADQSLATFDAVQHSLGALARRHGLQLPECRSVPFASPGWETKRRRIVCLARCPQPALQA
ncbi:MAG: CoF synthetase [Formivibrio sp.]|nr:CoF synthetase [Formivibrio sp.]